MRVVVSDFVPRAEGDVDGEAETDVEILAELDTLFVSEVDPVLLDEAFEDTLIRAERGAFVADPVRVDFDEVDIAAEFDGVFDADVDFVLDFDFKTELVRNIVGEIEGDDETENEDVREIRGDIEVVTLTECFRGVEVAVTQEDGVFVPKPVEVVERVCRKTEEDSFALTVCVFVRVKLLVSEGEAVEVRDAVFDADTEPEVETDFVSKELLVSVAVPVGEFVPREVAVDETESLRDPDTETLLVSLCEISPD